MADTTALRAPHIMLPEDHQNERVPLSPANLSVPAIADPTDFGDDAGVGMADASVEERTTPILRILHYQCDEIDENSPRSIPGAKPGMILNIATRNVHSGQEGLSVVICARERVYTAWVPRGKGEGGFRGQLLPDDPVVRETVDRMTLKHGRSARFRMPRFDPKNGWSDDPSILNGEEVMLNETGQFYVLFAPSTINSGNAQRAIIPFMSSNYPIYTHTIDRHNGWTFPQRDGSRRPGPAWCYRWLFTSKPDSNSRGKFFTWRTELAARDARGALYATDDPDLYRMGREFYEMWAAGQVKIDASQMSSVSSSEPTRDGGPNDVPF
jgi:hypothetical protein